MTEHPHRRFKDPDRLMAVWQTPAGQPRGERLKYSAVTELKKHSRLAERLAMKFFTRTLGPSVAEDKIAVALIESSGHVWMIETDMGQWSHCRP